MTNILKSIPAIIESEDNGLTSQIVTRPSVITNAFMAENFSNLGSLAYGYSYSNNFVALAKSITSPINIGEFLKKIREINVKLAIYLMGAMQNLDIDFDSTNIVEFIFASNMINQLDKNDKQLEEDLADLLLAMSQSPVYKNVSPTQARSHIAEMFTKDEERQKVQANLAVAFMKNTLAQDTNAWYDYTTFEEVSALAIPDIADSTDLIEEVKSLSITSCQAVMQFIKDAYLSEEDQNNPGYCESELEREYKASVILAILAQKTNDPNNQIGFNLLARIKNIPTLIEQDNSLTSVTNIINRYDEEAAVTAGQILFPEKQNASASEPTRAGVIDAETHIRRQLNTFKMIVDKKIAQLAKTLTALEKYKSRKAAFGKIEETLEVLAQEFDVTLTTATSTKERKDAMLVNIELLSEAIRQRIDDLLASQKLLTRIRKKMGSNVEISEIPFDKDLLGDYVNLSNDYIEQLIKEFYDAIASNPQLKSNKKYLQHIPTHTALKLKGTVAQGTVLSRVFSAFVPTKAQATSFEESELLDQMFEEETSI